MNKFTLLHSTRTDNTNCFILYSTRSNGTHFFVGSATVEKTKQDLFEISQFNSRKGYKSTLLKALFQFFNRINSYLFSSIPIADMSALKDDFQKLYANTAVSRKKISIDKSLSTKHKCLEYGYKIPTSYSNITFSSDQTCVAKRMKEWVYFSSLFPSDAETTIDAIEPEFT